MNHFKIAIDGPAGSGKSTISRILANRINFIYIDTGALYRAVTYYALKEQTDIEYESNFKFLETINLTFENEVVLLNNQDVSKKIRSNEVSRNVSVVAKHKYVREKLVEIMRDISLNNNVVMDGRDIGSVVFPDADLKIYLTAEINTRAKRRLLEVENKIELKEMIKDLEFRDDQDMNRLESPLVICDDAVVIDSTNMSIDEVLLNIIKKLKNKKII